MGVQLRVNDSVNIECARFCGRIFCIGRQRP
nr:MAG TPA_asm: hypothetical protein [Caudoviricetes sp.]